jgi:hypothetical protein
MSGLHILNAATEVSLLPLCIAMLVLWVGSYRARVAVELVHPCRN